MKDLSAPFLAGQRDLLGGKRRVDAGAGRRAVRHQWSPVGAPSEISVTNGYARSAALNACNSALRIWLVS